MEYEGTKILIRFRGREFNAKSLLGLLSACVQQMDEIILVCDGPQEQRASEELAAFIEQELEGEVFRSVNTDREATAIHEQVAEARPCQQSGRDGLRISA